MEEKSITITERYLKESVDYISSSLVGKLLKRFEILEDKNQIKSEAKELIYEEFRHLRDVLLAFEKGREMSIFQFKQKPTRQE
jgi:hypothetical protein